jgi:hypothetical protein
MSYIKIVGMVFLATFTLSTNAYAAENKPKLTKPVQASGSWKLQKGEWIYVTNRPVTSMHQMMLVLDNKLNAQEKEVIQKLPFIIEEQ